MNKVFFVGRLTKDAEMINKEDRSAVKFRLAVNSGGSAKNQRTLFITCFMWRKTETVSKLLEYLIKGKLVAVVGELVPLETEGDQQVYIVTVRELEFLSGGGKDSSETEEGGLEEIGDEIEF